MEKIENDWLDCQAYKILKEVSKNVFHCGTHRVLLLHSTTAKRLHRYHLDRRCTGISKKNVKASLKFKRANVAQDQDLD